MASGHLFLVLTCTHLDHLARKKENDGPSRLQPFVLIWRLLFCSGSRVSVLTVPRNPRSQPRGPLVGPLGTPWAPQGGPFGHPMGPPRWALWAPRGPPVSQMTLASAGGLPPPRPPATPGGLKPPRTPRLSRPSASEARSLSRARSLAIASSKRRGGLPPPRTPPANYEGAPPPQTPPRFTG